MYCDFCSSYDLEHDSCLSFDDIEFREMQGCMTLSHMYQIFGFHGPIPSSISETFLFNCFHKLDSDIRFRRIVFLRLLSEYAVNFEGSELRSFLDSWVCGIDVSK